MTPEINKFYHIDGLRLRCVKVAPCGLATFHVVDQQGNQIMKYNNGLVKDPGIRIIWKRLDQLKPE